MLVLIAGLWALLRRRVRLQNLHVGALLGCTLLLWLLSFLLPDISYLVMWPLLFGILPPAWTFLAGKWAGHPAWRVTVLVVATAPAAMLLPGTIHGIVALLNRFEGLMGLPMLGLAMLFVAPLIGLFGPHFDLLSGRRRWGVPGVAALVAVALIAWGNATSGFDAAHPRPNRIAYELDADTGAARWVSADHDLDAWTAQFFPSGVTRGADGLWTTPAPAVALPTPEVAVVNDRHDGCAHACAARPITAGCNRPRRAGTSVRPNHLGCRRRQDARFTRLPLGARRRATHELQRDQAGWYRAGAGRARSRSESPSQKHPMACQ